VAASASSSGGPSCVDISGSTRSGLARISCAASASRDAWVVGSFSATSSARFSPPHDTASTLEPGVPGTATPQDQGPE
jgi:hypothetical protein